MMKTIGIKLADGTFYPILKEGKKAGKSLELTTVHNNQTKVMIDLYRSEACKMLDAEYVDSLQLENLNAHPEGEANIAFTISIDKKNNLNAKIQDTETGNQNSVNITLVSRPETTVNPEIAENLAKAEDDETPTELAENGVKILSSHGPGLLQTAEAIRNASETEKTAENENAAEEEEKADEKTDKKADLPKEVEEAEIQNNGDEKMDELKNNDEEDYSTLDIANMDLNLPEDSAEEAQAESSLADEANLDLDLPDFPEDSADESLAESSTEASDLNLELPDFPEEPAEESLAENSPADDANLDLDLPDFPEEPAEESPAESSPTDEANLDLDLPDFPENSADESPAESSAEASDLNLELPDFPEEPAEESTAESSPTDQANLDLDLPDFPEDSADESLAENSAEASDLNLELPDFSEEPAEESTAQSSPTDEANLDLDLPDFPEDSADESLAESSPADDANLDLDLPDFPEDTEEESPDFDLPDNSTASAAGAFDFGGLYDEETELPDENSCSKKTRLPLIICIICAVICLLATAAILFILPSRYNLITRAAEKTPQAIQTTEPIKEEAVAEAPAEEEPEPEVEAEKEPEPEVPSAKEEEIIIIEKAEEVVPEQPPVVEEKPKNIIYKIKWGDTLWDIANTYYKNPWRYKEIARYNGIKDPDHIVSGTIIEIPAE